MAWTKIIDELYHPGGMAYDELRREIEKLLNSR
jgi:hypothetical protein